MRKRIVLSFRLSLSRMADKTSTHLLRRDEVGVRLLAKQRPYQGPHATLKLSDLGGLSERRRRRQAAPLRNKIRKVPRDPVIGNLAVNLP